MIVDVMSIVVKHLLLLSITLIIHFLRPQRKVFIKVRRVRLPFSYLLWELFELLLFLRLCRSPAEVSREHAEGQLLEGLEKLLGDWLEEVFAHWEKHHVGNGTS